MRRSFVRGCASRSLPLLRGVYDLATYIVVLCCHIWVLLCRQHCGHRLLQAHSSSPTSFPRSSSSIADVLPTQLRAIWSHSVAYGQVFDGLYRGIPKSICFNGILWSLLNSSSEVHSFTLGTRSWRLRQAQILSTAVFGRYCHILHVGCR